MKSKLSQAEKKVLSQIQMSEVMRIAEDAGKILIKYQKKRETLKVHHKESQGLASDADLASEAFILKQINKLFPTHQILAEESSYLKGQEYGAELAEPMWVIDPLDGTNNYLNRIDYYSVCLGLVVKGKPILGVVHRPTTGEFFCAIKGQGSYKWLQGKKHRLLAPFNQRELKDSIFATGFAAEKSMFKKKSEIIFIEKEFLLFKTLLLNSRALRRMGSAALDMCYLAEGVYDGFWERFLSPWDVAAAGIICQEAGVKITDYYGQEFSPFDKSILAARPPLHAKIKNLIRKAEKAFC